MFCTNCGFAQQNRGSNYCSGCGSLVSSSVHPNFQGQFNQPYPTQNTGVSMRKHGLKIGGKMILAGLIIVPILGIMSELFRINPVLAGLAALICFWGGFLRMVYAAIFEGNETQSLEQKLVGFYTKHLKRKKAQPALPGESVNFSNVSYGKHGMWRENADAKNKNENERW